MLYANGFLVSILTYNVWWCVWSSTRWCTHPWTSCQSVRPSTGILPTTCVNCRSSRGPLPRGVASAPCNQRAPQPSDNYSLESHLGSYHEVKERFTRWLLRQARRKLWRKAKSPDKFEENLNQQNVYAEKPKSHISPSYWLIQCILYTLNGSFPGKEMNRTIQY